MPSRAIFSLGEILKGKAAPDGAAGQLLDDSGKPQTGFNVRAFPTVASVAAEMFLLDEVWPRNPWTRRYLVSDLDYSCLQTIDQPARHV